MLKRFMFASIGILALAVAYQLGTSGAIASWDGNAPGLVVGSSTTFVTDPATVSGGICFTAAGEAWFVGDGVDWTRLPDRDLPVPASEVKFLDTENAGSGAFTLFLVTKSDEAWGFRGYEGGPWVSFGTFPGSTSVESKSFGSIKGAYRE